MGVQRGAGAVPCAGTGSRFFTRPLAPAMNSTAFLRFCPLLRLDRMAGVGLSRVLPAPGPGGSVCSVPPEGKSHLEGQSTLVYFLKNDSFSLSSAGSMRVFSPPEVDGGGPIHWVALECLSLSPVRTEPGRFVSCRQVPLPGTGSWGGWTPVNVPAAVTAVFSSPSLSLPPHPHPLSL